MKCTLFFFFKQKTAYEMRISDWSSDVCSSDLNEKALRRELTLGGAASILKAQQRRRNKPAYWPCWLSAPTTPKNCGRLAFIRYRHALKSCGKWGTKLRPTA